MSTKLQVRVLGCALILLLASPLGVAATDDAKGTATYTRTFVVLKSNAQYVDIARWLSEHGVDGGKSAIDDNENPFEVTVTTSESLDTRGKSGPPGSPFPLPRNGADGDVITFKRNRSCVDGGGVETWTYEWSSAGSSGGWRLSNYSFSNRGGINCDT